MADPNTPKVTGEIQEIGVTGAKDVATPNEKSAPILDEPFKGVQSPAPTSDALQQQAPSALAGATQSNLVTPLERLGEEPAWVDCPHCEKRTQTKIEKHDSSQTTLAGFLCCLFCGVIFACVPCLCHWCADIEHRCSECGKSVAWKPHEGQTQPRYPQGPTNRPSQYAALPAGQRAKMEMTPAQSPAPAPAPVQSPPPTYQEGKPPA